MPKHLHEIRDPLHGFIHLTTEERRVLASRPMERLRNVHQLAMSYQVYPSATHRRFEHSLGVMELATRIYDTVTRKDLLHPEVSELLPELADEDKIRYWRSVVRMAALCHDTGHLPFSHAGEDLLPKGKSHEVLTRLVIEESDEMEQCWTGLPLRPASSDIAKVALGPEKYPEPLTEWERVLSEIVTGDVLGADRMDYLLRDAYHTGVTYGKFDHLRLLESLRILPQPADSGDTNVVTPALGIEEGAIAAAESLLFARQAMYTQVYHHHVRLAYNLHLQQFLQHWLPEGKFKIDLKEHLSKNDNHVLVAMEEALDKQTPAGDAARRILHRRHFKRLYTITPKDRTGTNPLESLGTLDDLKDSIGKEFGMENVEIFRKQVRGGRLEFPVIRQGEEILQSLNVSEMLSKLPEPMIEIVLVEPSIFDKASKWLKKRREHSIQQT